MFSVNTMHKFLCTCNVTCALRAQSQPCMQFVKACTPKNISIRIACQVVILDACGTWHALYMVTSIHSFHKSTRSSQKPQIQDSRMTEDSGVKTEKMKLKSKKKSEEKEKRCSKEAIDWCFTWGKIKTVFEEQGSSYLHFAGQW